MATAKKFFHDHVVLLLLSISAFIMLASVVSVLLRLLNGEGSGYIVQFRPGLGIGAYESGSVLELVSFAAFAVMTFVIHLMLSMRAYHIRRQLTLAILGMGIVLLLFSTVIANALLSLR